MTLGRGRVERRIEVQHAPTVVPDDEEAIEHPKLDCGDCEEVHCCNRLLVVLKESDPSLNLVRIRWTPGHVARHGRLAEVESQFQELTVDPRSSPIVARRHTANEFSQFEVDQRPTGLAIPVRNPRPVSSKTLPVPLHDRVGCDDHEPAGPTRPGFPKSDPEAPTRVVEARPLLLALQGHQLLTQSEVLQDEICPRSGKRLDSLNDDHDNGDEESREGEHGCEILADMNGDLKPAQTPWALDSTHGRVLRSHRCEVEASAHA